MYYKVFWEVIHGKKLWRTIGFPTANLFLASSSDLEDGTYACNSLYKNKVYRWVGVFRKDIELFEVHLFDFDGDLYWQSIEVWVYKKIRNNMQFHSLEEIQAQIIKDVAHAKNIKNTVLTFWTFDIIHPGHVHYLNHAKMRGSKLITVISTSKNREKIIWDTPTQNLEQRIEWIENLAIADLVLAGSEENPLESINIHKPHCICLWYDQEGFSYLLQDLDYDFELVRIDAYKPDSYKSSLLK